MTARATEGGPPRLDPASAVSDAYSLLVQTVNGCFDLGIDAPQVLNLNGLLVHNTTADCALGHRHRVCTDVQCFELSAIMLCTKQSSFKRY